MSNSLIRCHFCEKPDCEFRGRPEYCPLDQGETNEKEDNQSTN